jgi:hypothetical protein
MAVTTFDSAFYRTANPDLAGLSGTALFQHFRNAGLAEGRPFSAYVDLGFYRAANPDLAGLNNAQLLSHLEQAGVAEGRRFSPYADVNFYLAANSDLARAFGQNREAAFNHLRSNAVAEFRAFSPYVDLDHYRLLNDDVNQAFGGRRQQLFEHLVISGVREGRKFSPFVDLSAYLSSNSDVEAAFGGDRRQVLQHLQLAGLNEGRQFSVALDLGYYLQANSDVAQAVGNNRERAFNHLVAIGFNENRRFAVNYDSQVYRQRYSEIGGLSNQALLSIWLGLGLILGEEATVDPGNTPGAAYQVGSLNSFTSPTSELLFGGELSASDAVDYYRFSVDRPTMVYGLVNIVLGNSALDLSIQDSSGTTTLVSSQVLVNEYSATARILNPGTYLLRIAQPNGGTSTRYLLDLGRTTPLPVESSGNTVVAAPLSLTERPSRGVIQDRVDSSNAFDFYALDLDSPGTFSATLSGLGQDVDLFLYDSSGTVVASSNLSGTRDEFLSAPLQPGVYLLGVSSFLGSASDYRLSLALT